MRAIDENGLDEEIRCEMCKNPMHTDRGCDGNCKYDEKLYEKIIQILNKRITPLPSAQPEANRSEFPNNSDTISRQAAIDALGYCQTYLFDSRDDDKKISLEDAEYAIEQLPPAQPEIIRCKDCKYAEIADPKDNQDGYTCQFHRGSIWFSGSYCSWAERRRNENNNV